MKALLHFFNKEWGFLNLRKFWRRTSPFPTSSLALLPRHLDLLRQISVRLCFYLAFLLAAGVNQGSSALHQPWRKPAIPEVQRNWAEKPGWQFSIVLLSSSAHLSFGAAYTGNVSTTMTVVVCSSLVSFCRVMCKSTVTVHPFSVYIHTHTKMDAP